jgi:hypothetical protein
MKFVMLQILMSDFKFESGKFATEMRQKCLSMRQDCLREHGRRIAREVALQLEKETLEKETRGRKRTCSLVDQKLKRKVRDAKRRDAICQKNKEWRSKNVEKVRQYRRRRYLKNATTERAASSKYYWNHRERIRQGARDKKATELDNGNDARVKSTNL